MKVYVPRTIEEAFDYLILEQTMALAGGTNLLVDRKKGKYKDIDLVSLDALGELKQVKIKEDGVHIGALVCFDDLEREFCDNPAYRAISMAAALVGGPQIRNRGTIGGNILSASPAADIVPVLLALDACLTLCSKEGERVVPIEGFMVSPGRTQIKKGEILTKIVLKNCTGRSCFYKAGKRNALAISILNQAVYLDLKEGRIQEIRIAVGSAAPTALRLRKTEDMLTGADVEGENWFDLREAAGQQAAAEISPIDDIRAEKEYRRLLTGNILRENLKQLTKKGVL